MQRIYRGYLYRYTPSEAQPYYQPPVLSWQLHEATSVRLSQKAATGNWHYQGMVEA